MMLSLMSLLYVIVVRNCFKDKLEKYVEKKAPCCHLPQDSEEGYLTFAHCHQFLGQNLNNETPKHEPIVATN